MAAQGWTDAAKETAIQASFILASDAIIKSFDGHLDLAKYKNALELLAKKGGFKTTVGTAPSLTLEHEVAALLKAHGVDSTHGLPDIRGISPIQGTPSSYQIVLNDAKGTTLQMTLPHRSLHHPISSTIPTYIQAKINTIKAFLATVIPQIDLTNSRIQQFLVGSTVVFVVFVGGIALFRLVYSARGVAMEHKANEGPVEPLANEMASEREMTEEAVSGNDDDEVSGGGSVGSELEDDELEGVEQVNEGDEPSLEDKYEETLRMILDSADTIESLKSQNEEQGELLGENASHIGDLEEDIEKLEASAKDRAIHITNLKSQLSKTEDAVKEKEGVITDLHTQVSKTEGIVKDQDDIITRLHSRLAKTENDSKEKDDMMRRLAKRVSDLEKTQESTAERIKKNAAKDSKHLTDDNTRLKAINFRLQNESRLNAKTITSLQTENEKQKQAVATLEKQQSTLEDEIRKLKGSNAELATTIQDQQTELDDGEVAFQSKMDTIDCLNDEKGQVQAGLDHANKTIDSLRLQAGVHEGHVKELEEKIAGLRSASKKKDEDLQALTEKNASLTEEIHRTEEEAQSAIEQYEKNFAELEDENKNLDGANVEFATKARRAQEVIDKLTQERDAAKSEHDQARSDRDQSQFELNHVRTQLADSHAENRMLKAALASRTQGSGDAEERGDDEEDKGDGDDEDGKNGDEDGGPEDGCPEDDGPADEGPGGDMPDDDGNGGHGRGSGQSGIGGDKKDQDEGGDVRAEGDGDDQNDDDDDDQGDDTHDAGAGKLAQGGDDNLAGEQPSRPTTAQTAQRQTFKGDGLQETNRFPSLCMAPEGQATDDRSQHVGQQSLELYGMRETTRFSLLQGTSCVIGMMPPWLNAVAAAYFYQVSSTSHSIPHLLSPNER